MEFTEAIRRINTYKQSAIFVRSDGTIVDVIEVDTRNPQQLIEKSHKYEGCASRIYDLPSCGSISQEGMEKIMQELVEGLEYAKSHKLKPGINVQRPAARADQGSILVKLKSLFFGKK